LMPGCLLTLLIATGSESVSNPVSTGFDWALSFFPQLAKFAVDGPKAGMHFRHSFLVF
jgi:hypothetical protein